MNMFNSWGGEDFIESEKLNTQVSKGIRLKIK